MFVLLIVAGCASPSGDRSGSEDPTIAGKADGSSAEALLEQVLAVDCVQSAELEMTVLLNGEPGEPTGRVIAVLRDGVEANACAEEIRETDPSLRIDEVFDDFGMLTVSRASMGTRAEELAARVRTIECVASAEPERIVGVASDSGISDQTGRVIVTVRPLMDVAQCADKVRDSEPTMEVSDVAIELGIFLVGPRYELPSDAAFLAAEISAIECVASAEPERIMTLGGEDGGETGRVLAVVRDGFDADECADAITESDPTLRIDDVLATAGVITVSRP
jgi:hypothetical protein